MHRQSACGGFGWSWALANQVSSMVLALLPRRAGTTASSPLQPPPPPHDINWYLDSQPFPNLLNSAALQLQPFRIAAFASLFSYRSFYSAVPFRLGRRAPNCLLGKFHNHRLSRSSRDTLVLAPVAISSSSLFVTTSFSVDSSFLSSAS